MKLLVVIPYYWPALMHGGPVVSLHGLNKAMAEKGVDVTVYTTDVDLQGEVPVNRETLVDGVKVTYFSFSPALEFITPFGWQFSPRLGRALKEDLNRFDLVYINTVWRYPAAIAAYYCRRYLKPYIIAPRGMLYPELFSKKLWKKWPYYKLFVEKSLKFSWAIHYTSEDEALRTEEFLRLNKRRLIVPNGIDVPDFQQPADRDSLNKRYPQLKNKKIILFLGRLNWKKGLDILVKAFAKLARERGDARLLIAGPDELRYKEKIKDWIRQSGLAYNGQVTFTGMLKGEEKLEVYRNSEIFILPSYSENFGVTVVEALASGLAVIISNKVGICEEVLKNKAGMVIDTQAESAYKALKLLLDDPALRKELGINGRKLAEENYSVGKIADKMIGSFREALETR